jgi:hypothetical protein
MYIRKAPTDAQAAKPGIHASYSKHCYEIPVRSGWLCSLFPNCRTDKKSYLSLYTSIGNGTATGTFTKSKGAASLDGSRMVHIGADYTRSINTWLSWGAGIEYADHSLTQHNHSSASSMGVQHGHIQRLSAPVYLRADVLNFIFMTFGVVLNKQLKNDFTTDPSGIGITGGTGVKLDIKRFRLYLQPYYQWFLLPFSDDPNDRLIHLSVRTGVAFRL